MIFIQNMRIRLPKIDLNNLKIPDLLLNPFFDDVVLVYYKLLLIGYSGTTSSEGTCFILVKLPVLYP